MKATKTLVATQMNIHYTEACGKYTNCAYWLDLVVPIGGNVSIFEKHNTKL